MTTTDATLATLAGDERPLGHWLTNFPLLLTVVDPYTVESSWILDTARRIMRGFANADCRVAWLSTADADGTRSFLGPLADEFLTFADPDRSAAKVLGIESLPALVFVRQNGTIAAAACGWMPSEWRDVVESVGAVTAWSLPAVPAAGDPSSYPGTPLG